MGLSFPEQAWKNVSKGALDFILRLLQVRAGGRLTADQALSHPWLRSSNNGTSFSSFENPNPMPRGGSNVVANFYGQNTHNSGNPDLQRGSSQPHVPHPLEHAHKVSPQGQQEVSAQPMISRRQMQGPPPTDPYGQPGQAG